MINFFGFNSNVHHVGLAVKSIKTMYPDIKIVEDATQKVYVAFVVVNGFLIELLEPLGEDSPVIESLKRNSKLLHICYEVDNLDDSLKDSRKYGFHIVSSKASAPALNGRTIVWIYNKDFGLFELVEKYKNG